MNTRSIATSEQDPDLTQDSMPVWELAGSATTGARQTLVQVAQLPAGAALPLHRHPNAEETSYVIAGTATFLTEHDEIPQHPGDSAFVRVGEWHGLRNDSDQPATLMVIYGGVGNFAEVTVENAPREPVR